MIVWSELLIEVFESFPLEDPIQWIHEAVEFFKTALITDFIKEILKKLIFFYEKWIEVVSIKKFIESKKFFVKNYNIKIVWNINIINKS